MSCERENLEVLRRRHPEVAARLEKAPPLTRAARWSEADGQMIAARWLAGRRLRDGVLLAVSGFGDGAHVRVLLKVLPPRAVVFVGEAEPATLRGALERSDLRDVLEDARLLLGLGAIDDAYFAPIRARHVLGMSDVQPLLFAPEFNRAPDYYARFFTEFARVVDFRRKLEGTRLKDAPLWQGNTFANLSVLAPAPDLAALRDVFRGRPLVLVSAGPSLDESLDFLREASRVAVIVAVNSSYRAVRRAGIVPHLVLAADPREFTARGFSGVPTSETWLFTTPIVYPEVARMFAGRTFLWSGSNELYTEIRSRLGMAPGTKIVEQGTVSACAVDIAVIMGCDRVCLVGQDLAIRSDGRTHAQDSFYTDLKSNQVDTSTCRRAPGNTFPEVLVEDKLFVYLKTFEQLVACRPGLRFRNTARLGARIAGVPYATFPEALSWLGKKTIGDVFGALRRRQEGGSSSAMDQTRLRAALEAVHQFARAVLGRALRAATACEAVPAGLPLERAAEDPLARKALEAVRDLELQLAGDPSSLRILESGQTRIELFKAREMEARVDHLPELERRMIVATENAWAMAEGAWFLIGCLERFFGEVEAAAPQAEAR